jgi:hypothetical protein
MGERQEKMAADVTEWLNQPDSNFGWILIGDESTMPTAKRFASRENPTESDRPVLTITYRTETLVTDRPNSNLFKTDPQYRPLK